MAFNSGAGNKGPGITQRSCCHGHITPKNEVLIIISHQFSAQMFPSSKCCFEGIKDREYFLNLQNFVMYMKGKTPPKPVVAEFCSA